jgi:hypothetical protein
VGRADDAVGRRLIGAAKKRDKEGVLGLNRSFSGFKRAKLGCFLLPIINYTKNTNH